MLDRPQNVTAKFQYAAQRPLFSLKAALWIIAGILVATVMIVASAKYGIPAVESF
jgi:hypothetical protein